MLNPMHIAPWQLDQVAGIWDQHAAKALGWRIFTLGKAGSKPKACKRLTAILLSNRNHLQCRGGADLDELFDAFSAQLLVSLIHVEAQGVEVVNSKLDAHYSIRMTFWVFIRDLANLAALSNEALGRHPDAADQDKARRDAKATMLKAFQSEVTDWISHMAYLSRDDNAKLAMALAAARRALAIAEDELSD
jgi:hypothetical protein